MMVFDLHLTKSDVVKVIMVKNYSSLFMRCPPFPVYISSGKSAFNPGDVHVDRVFSTFVAMFIDEGIVHFTEGDIEYELHKGEWFIQTPGKRHYGHKPSNDYASFYWVHFMPLMNWSVIEINNRNDVYSDNINTIDSGEGVRVPQYDLLLPMNYSYPVDEWIYLLEDMTTTNTMYAQSLFIKLISDMCNIKKNEHLTAVDILANKVVAYVKTNNNSNKVSVKSISEHFHFAPDYISKCFKQRFGTTLRDFLNSAKMNYARNMLINTNNSIQDIANEIGYKDIAVFSRMFKRIQGTSPSYYRQKIWGSSMRQ